MPTHQNGLEEYVRAADQIGNPEFMGLSAAVDAAAANVDFPALRVSPRGSKHASLFQTESSLSSHQAPTLIGKDFSQLCVILESKYGSALHWIRSGNEKSLKASDSVFTNEDFLIDVGPFFRCLGNLGLRSAYAQLTAGKSAQAMGTLVDQITFSDRLSRFGSGGWGIGLDLNNALCNFLGGELGHLSLVDCEMLDKALIQVLSGRPAVLDYSDYRWRIWLQRISDDVRRILAAPPGNYGKAEPGTLDDQQLDTAIRGMSPADRQDLMEKATAIAKSAIQDFDARFSGPEKDWLGPLPDSRLFRPQGVTNDDDLATQLAYRSMPKASRASLVLSLKALTRLRLLEVHAKILAFRWRSYRLPKNLEEVSHGLGIDPLNGLEYQYKILREGTYELSSAGVEATGEIRLVASSPKPNPAKDLNP